MELTYRAFGLTISSELPLPGLPITDDPPEIHVRRGAIQEWSGDSTIRYGDRCKIRGQEWSVHFKALPFAGLIQDGNRIQFEADPAHDDAASLHVLGSCTGALLFQRGLIPLHGNTIATRDGAVMIAGRVGTGKSATTFALLQRNHRLLADDISAVSFGTSESVQRTTPRIVSGFPRLKLWKTTLDHFGCNYGEFRRLRPDMDKYYCPVDDRFCPTPQRLKAIYVLQPGDSAGIRIHALSGIDKLEAIRGHLYKIRFQDAIRNWPPLLAKMCRLADTVTVNVVERPREGVTIEAVAEAIETDFSKVLRVRAARA
jgi:hypothetical protein